MFLSVNPFTQQTIAEHALMNQGELEAAILNSERMKSNWRRLSLQKRVEMFKVLGEKFRLRKTELAELITAEMGKPLAEALAEVEKSISLIDYYSSEDHLKVLAPERLLDDSSVVFQPLGTVLAIMPWNFPVWQVVRFAVPTLLASNVVLVKHAPQTMACAKFLAQLFEEAGFGEGIYTNLVIDLDLTTSLIKDSRVAAVSLTGSVRAGRAVAALCGEYLKPSLLELGGSDAYVVCEDADFELAFDQCWKSRLLNAGQSCIAAKRMIVHERWADRWRQGTAELFESTSIGDPMQKGVRLGPLARRELADGLRAQIAKAQGLGAQVSVSSKISVPHLGFVAPMMLENFSRETLKEEFFGPVALLSTFSDEVQAVQMANQTPYGLGAAIFSNDADRARHLAQFELEAGSVFVNEMVRSDPRRPFGGIKDSGYGREMGDWGLRSFVNVKAVNF